MIAWTAKHHLKKNAEAVKLCAKQGFIRNLQIDYADKTGKKFTPIEINAAVVTLKDKPVIVTLCRDISERKKAEERVKKARDELAEKVEDLEKFSKVAIGRELKMVELKKEIRRLERKLGGETK